MGLPIHIVLVEDDADDVELFEIALQDLGVAHHLTVLTDGAAVHPHLTTQASLPDLMVLDLNLPKLSGKDVLVNLRSHPAFSSLPVAILTTSTSPEDRAACLAAGADAFLTKATTFDEFSQAIRTLVGLVHPTEG